MTHKDFIGFEIRSLNNLIMRRMVADAAKYGIDETTILHAWIIGYLYSNPEKEIFQKDIESEFSMAKSSTTCILKLMEKKGYITREPVPYDARLKKLCLTESGVHIVQRNRKNIDQMEAELRSCLEPEEIAAFLKIARKLKAGLDTYGVCEQNAKKAL